MFDNWAGEGGGARRYGVGGVGWVVAEFAVRGSARRRDPVVDGHISGRECRSERPIGAAESSRRRGSAHMYYGAPRKLPPRRSSLVEGRGRTTRCRGPLTNIDGRPDRRRAPFVLDHGIIHRGVQSLNGPPMLVMHLSRETTGLLPTTTTNIKVDARAWKSTNVGGLEDLPATRHTPRQCQCSAPVNCLLESHHHHPLTT